MWAMWHGFWKVVDGFHVAEILGLCVVMLALTFAVRGFNRLRRSLRDDDGRK